LGVERHDGTTLVTVAGEIDMASTSELRECLVGTQGHVIVDLRGVSFLDSSGIGTLASARTRLLQTGGDLRLRKPQGIVRTVLEVIGLACWIED
jgi:anti-anti-sigma factor